MVSSNLSLLGVTREDKTLPVIAVVKAVIVIVAIISAIHTVSNTFFILPSYSKINIDIVLIDGIKLC